MSDCIEWKGSKDSQGYGRVKVGGKTTAAHRIAWEEHHGKGIPEGSVILHDCDNPSCVNPDHLTLGTQSQNIRDAFARGRKKPPNKGIEELLTDAQLSAVLESDLSSETLALTLPVSGSTVRMYRRLNGQNRVGGAPRKEVTHV